MIWIHLETYFILSLMKWGGLEEREKPLNIKYFKNSTLL